MSDRELIERLRKSLAQALNFIEHQEASHGKALSSAGWDAAVAAFRKSGTSQISISGSSYVPKASFSFAAARAALEAVEKAYGPVPPAV